MKIKLPTLHPKAFLIATVVIAILLQGNHSLIANSNLSDEELFRTVREATRSGRLPREGVLLEIERQAGSIRARDLARLVRARIRFDAGDFRNVVGILNERSSDESTKIGDYKLWLKGRSLAGIKDHRAAIATFDELIAKYPESLLLMETKLLKAESLVELGQLSVATTLLEAPAEENDLRALSLLARVAQLSGERSTETRLLRRIFFYGGTGSEVKAAESRLLQLGESLVPSSSDELLALADVSLVQGNFAAAIQAYDQFLVRFPQEPIVGITNKRISALMGAGRFSEAAEAIRRLPRGARGRDEFLYRLAVGYAKSNQWQLARQTSSELESESPKGRFTARALVESGMAARAAKNRVEEEFFLRRALREYPEAVEVAPAQFELAWLEHQSGNHAKAAEMLIEHLARYSDKDSTHRGRAGYWAARNSERAGRLEVACTLYDALVYRYHANWYGHIGKQRLDGLRSLGRCVQGFTSDPLVRTAADNLKKITVAPERSGPQEILRAEKSEELSVIGLFDWSLKEIEEAQRVAQNSPRVNLALARHHKLKGDNVSALLALAKSYPDYSQMFPEEMTPAEWEIFYPLTNWKDIKTWAVRRSLDPFKVAGLIRQESVFNPRARSSANAYGLMQLLLPTARQTARKYNPALANMTVEQLYDPAVNIELGTAYMKDQLERYGRVEYMSAAYNAGPGRMTQWRQTLPAEIDEFVEAVPFRETRGYIQGIIRNTEQYRRLYDENGNFRSNVGTNLAAGLN
jgi:soluble lytic murein transglycosylase